MFASTNNKADNNIQARPNAVWTALIALVFSLALVACCWDAFKSRSVEFRYRVVDRELAPLFEKSYVFYKSMKDPLYSGRQRGKVDAGLVSADGFVDVFVPGVATDFRLDVVFKNVLALFKDRKELVLEVDVAGLRREIRLPFRKDKPFYAWASFAARDFIVVRFNAWACLSVLCLAWVFFSILVSAFRCMTPAHENVLLVCLFAVVCALPLAKMDKSDASSRENRRLERFPDGRLAASEGPSAWCKQFEAAFADRFFCRYWLMDVHSAIVGLFDDRGNSKVHVGRDGWLFLKSTLDDFSNAAQMYDRQTMERIRDYLDSIGDYAKRNGKKFVVFVAPDKCRVYPEKVRFLKKVRPDSESRVEGLLAYLRDNCRFPIIYPREKLLSLKSSSLPPLYYSGDTHWTDVSAYYGGYLPVMEALAIEDTPLLIQNEWREHPWWGDLRLMLGDTPTEEFAKILKSRQKKDAAVWSTPRPGCVANDGVATKEMNSGGGDVYRVIKTANPHVKGHSLYCIRDSFFSDLIPYFARSFSSATFRHCRRGIKPEDIEEIDKCDVIVLEIVERDITSLVHQQVPMVMRKEAR